MSGPSPWSGTFYGVPAEQDKIEHSDVVYPGPMGVEEAAPHLAKAYSDKKSYNEIFTAISSDSRYSAWPASDRRRLTRYVAEQILYSRRITTQLNFPMGTNVDGDVCNPVCHGQNPWSAEFYGVEPARDEIEHFGVKGMKWKEHLKAKAEELGVYNPEAKLEDPKLKNLSDRKNSPTYDAAKKVKNKAVATKDKGLAALNNAQTKRSKSHVDAAINFIVRNVPHGVNQATGKSVTYKDIQKMVAATMPKASDKERKAAADGVARQLITGTSSATSVDSVKQERLNKKKN